MSMSTKARKQLVAGFKRIQQMKRRDRPPRTVGLLCFLGNYQRWATSLFNHSRRHNPNDATVPSVTIKNHTELPCQARLSGKLLFNFCNDPLLFCLAFKIELVQFFRDLFTTVLIL